ncbi:MAG: hypothetical protein IKS00_01970 [Bacteroidales bacterium]|nr:hypothetical protein [Bacteroidales bacterium]
MPRRLLLPLVITVIAALCCCGGGAKKSDGAVGKKSYAISTDTSDRPGPSALLKLLYPDDPGAKVDFCSPILVDGKKYYFVKASHGFFNDGNFYYGFTDYYFVTVDGTNLKAGFTIKAADTTFYGNEMEFESNSMRYSLVAIGKASVGLASVMSATNQGFWENYRLSLLSTESVIPVFDIESSFDNAMWFPDNPTVYDNEVKVIPTQNDMYDLVVTHKTYDVVFLGDDLDYDTKVTEQTETRYIFSPIELKYVEK